MNVTIGLDLGQRRHPSWLCVVEAEERLRDDGRRLDHFLVRHLERLQVGSPSLEVARRTREVVAAIHRRTEAAPQLFVDATGLGDVQEKPGRWVLHTLVLD